MINKTEKALKPDNQCQKIIKKDEMIATNKGFITFNQEEEGKQHSRNFVRQCVTGLLTSAAL